MPNSLLPSTACDFENGNGPCKPFSEAFDNDEEKCNPKYSIPTAFSRRGLERLRFRTNIVGNGCIFEIEAPGIGKDDIDVTIMKNRIFVRAERYDFQYKVVENTDKITKVEGGQEELNIEKVNKRLKCKGFFFSIHFDFFDVLDFSLDCSGTKFVSHSDGLLVLYVPVSEEKSVKIPI